MRAIDKTMKAAILFATVAPVKDGTWAEFMI